MEKKGRKERRKKERKKEGRRKDKRQPVKNERWTKEFYEISIFNSNDEGKVMQLR